MERSVDYLYFQMEFVMKTFIFPNMDRSVDYLSFQLKYR